MPTEFRAFYAAEIDENVRKDCLDTILKLQKQDWGNQVRWSKSDNLHITIRFLGEVNQETTDTINEQLADTYSLIKPFTVQFQGISLFPSKKKPRVIVANVEKNEALETLYKKTEVAAIRAGIKAETRQFMAHLTLGRCKDKFPRNVRIKDSGFRSKLTVKKISLYKSDLTQQGSFYTILKTFTL